MWRSPNSRLQGAGQMKIALSILIIAIATAPLTSSAVTPEDQEAQRWTDHYNTVFKYSMMASGDAIKRHGKVVDDNYLDRPCCLTGIGYRVASVRMLLH
jgi:hypothetical protein